MRKYVVFFVLIILIPLVGNTQICVSYRLENKQIQGADLYFDLYLNTTASSTSDLYLGNSDFIVDFNSSNFLNPVLTKEAFQEPILGINIGFCTFTAADTSAGTTLFLRSNYYSSTVTQIIGSELFINLLGPTPSSVATYNTDVAKIDGAAQNHRLGRFKLSGFTGTTLADAGLQFKEGTTGFQTKIYSMQNDGQVFPEEFVTCRSAFNMELFAYLEGPYNTTSGMMDTYLNLKAGNGAYRGLLPGQAPFSANATPTPAGQPYSVAPWSYSGTEGDNVTDYPESVVDWLLITLRTDLSTNVWRSTAWLHEDGRITLLEIPETDQLPDSAFVVIHHRNHLAIMSPEKLPLENRVTGFDFRSNDAQIVVPGVGQKQILPGVYAMHAGDGDQTSDVITGQDINGSDNVIWAVNNGLFDTYDPADYNMSGDLSGNDKLVWSVNNGLFIQIPK